MSWQACWELADARDLIQTDVATQNEDAYFVALHQPPLLREAKVPAHGRPPGEEFEKKEPIANGQDRLLEYVRDEVPEAGSLVVPVIGEPGTGKSHIVKWLFLQLRGREDFVVRHIPREGVSLGGVIELILEGLEGKAFEEIRRVVGAQQDNAEDQAIMTTKLADSLALVLEHYDTNAAWPSAKGEGFDFHRKSLVAALHGRTTRAALTRAEGAVSRLAR
ncbi:MAG: ATP-binding protein, partial [Pirellulaceae bacterium]|nr:ATP-binding protein [Pirellulaceae bacterium]